MQGRLPWTISIYWYTLDFPFVRPWRMHYSSSPPLFTEGKVIFGFFRSKVSGCFHVQLVCLNCISNRRKALRVSCPSQCHLQIEHDEDERLMSEANPSLRISMKRGLCRRRRKYLDIEQSSEDSTNSPDVAGDYDSDNQPHGERPNS